MLVLSDRAAKSGKGTAGIGGGLVDTTVVMMPVMMVVVMLIRRGRRECIDDLGAAQVAGAEMERGAAGDGGRHVALRHNRPGNAVGQQRQKYQGALWLCCIAAMCGEA